MVVYTHTQSSPSATWTITHNLGCKPIVEVLVSTGGTAVTKIYPSKVEHVSDNSLVLEFTSSKSGKARLIGVVPA